MRNHGVFTIGSDARDAVKARSCRGRGRTVHTSPGSSATAPTPADIDPLRPYQNVYGQDASHEQPRIWFLTGSQHLYGPETLDQVAAVRRDRQQLDAADERSASRRGKPVLTDSGATIHGDAEATPTRPASGDRLDAHVLAGQDVDRRAWTRCASRCCTCTPRPTGAALGHRSTWTS
jgi:hypothetical protein